jgi:hypothetical protein
MFIKRHKINGKWQTIEKTSFPSDELLSHIRELISTSTRQEINKDDESICIMIQQETESIVFQYDGTHIIANIEYNRRENGEEIYVATLDEDTKKVAIDLAQKIWSRVM